MNSGNSASRHRFSLNNYLAGRLQCQQYRVECTHNLSHNLKMHIQMQTLATKQQQH